MIEYYENYFALNLPTPQVDTSRLNWLQYNPRKTVPRWGASLTSLDGKLTGVPDLDSIYEYNKINGTQYSEKDFKVKTPLYEPFNFLDQYFDLGRSHYLKLGTGGFFPYHRDFDSDTFRLIYTISGCDAHNLVWIQHDKIIKLENNRWYYINTKMIHSVFSFFGSEFVVFNMLYNDKAKKSLVDLMSVK